MKIIAAVFVIGLLAVASAPILAGPKALDLRFAIENQPRGTAHTPVKGSGERQAILDALRTEMKRLHQTDFIFTVKRLKVQRGWAWIEVAPRSLDGTSNFETVSALIRKGGKSWHVAQIACSEPDNPDCLSAPDFFKKLRAKFPKAPRSIFPR